MYNKCMGLYGYLTPKIVGSCCIRLQTTDQHKRNNFQHSKERLLGVFFVDWATLGQGNLSLGRLWIHMQSWCYARFVNRLSVEGETPRVAGVKEGGKVRKKRRREEKRGGDLLGEKEGNACYNNPVLFTPADAGVGKFWLVNQTIEQACSGNQTGDFSEPASCCQSFSKRWRPH